MKYQKEMLEAAHKYSIGNKPMLSQDKRCGCFFCGKIYDPKEITYYYQTDTNPYDAKGTAFCPYCSIDSVIGESAGFPLTKEFLDAMHDYWF